MVLSSLLRELGYKPKSESSNVIGRGFRAIAPGSEGGCVGSFLEDF
jgi:hypothetical protein